MKIIILLLTLFTNSYGYAESDLDAVKNCLQKFEKHPFDSKSPEFRTVKGGVKILGFGSNIVDRKKSDSVELILVKPAVSVIAKTTYKFLNPNGWYCMKAKVNVISNTTIELDCATRFTTSDGSVTVLGQDETSKGGVTIIGKTQIKRVNCKKN